MIGEDGERRTVYAGQWIDRDDPIVALNPHVTRPVADEEA